MQQYYVVNGNNNSQIQLFNGNNIQPMMNVNSSLAILPTHSLQIIPSMTSSIQSLNAYNQNGSYLVIIPPTPTNQININNNLNHINNINCMNSANVNINNINQQFNINRQIISFNDLQKQLQQISCSAAPNNISNFQPSYINTRGEEKPENDQGTKTEEALPHVHTISTSILSTSPSTASSNSDYSIITNNNSNNNNNNNNNNINKSTINIKRNKYSYQCGYCKRTFKQSHSLKDHIRIHTGERPYQCSYCNRKFKVKYNMIVHTRIHTGVKPYSCPICEKRYASKSGLNAHCKKHHPIQNPKQ